MTVQGPLYMRAFGGLTYDSTSNAHVHVSSWLRCGEHLTVGRRSTTLRR